MRWTLLAFLLLASCATAPARPRMISVELYERTPHNGPTRVSGSHLFRVQIHNESDEAITVTSISFAPSAASGGLQISNGVQSVSGVIEPTQTKNFNLWVTANGGGNDSAMSIDSLRVSVAARASSGDFVDSNVYQVIPE